MTGEGPLGDRGANPVELCVPDAPLIPGRYRHYKGREYIVVGVARHSETEEELVVYRQDYGDRGLWVRPLAMFREMVNVGGIEQPRFAYVSQG